MRSIRIITPREHALYRQHLLCLSAADRRLRFGGPLEDEAVGAHVAGLSTHDRILGHFGDDLGIIGAVHVAFCRHGAIELAFSVTDGHRGRGLGAALFARGVLFARNRGATSAHVYCLAENRKMRRLARHGGMEVVTAEGESEGRLDLPAANPMTFASEMLSEQAGLCDYGTKANSRAVRSLRRDPRPAA